MFASKFVTRLRNTVSTTSYLDNSIALPGTESCEQGLGLMRTFEISDRFGVNGRQHDGLKTKRPLGRL